MTFLMNIRFSFVVMVFGRLRGYALEARRRLLQVYDEEVTIRRTLRRVLNSRDLQRATALTAVRRERLESGRSLVYGLDALQRNARLTVCPSVALQGPEKNPEKPEWASSLEKKLAKVELWPGREKSPVQFAVSSAHAGTRFLRLCPDARTKRTTQT
jgi:hypothetical protein